MAGDWIKMRGNLAVHYKVGRIAVALSQSPELVVFNLYRLAGWFAEYGHYGKLACQTHLVDRFLGVSGFAHELAEVGWLGDWNGVLTLHEFCAVSTERKSLGKKIRAAVLSAGKCAGCGSTGPLEVDHIVPIVRGGSCQIENLQALCVPCNRSKGRKTGSEWKAVV